MLCKFVTELSKLRKLSMESVENTSTFNDFKKYLHVLRPVETELRDLLHKVNAENRKTLILLCGSAGDGKSHLMSYLRNADSENLLESFEIYNDATESSAPSLTAIDTLADRLSQFNDDHCQNDDGSKMILAINLGTLNNFIESEKGSKFLELRKYVESNGIFSACVRPNTYHSTGVFQHVNFSDYQVFSLKEDGEGTEYLEELIGRVFSMSIQNPFHTAFCENESCTLCQKCPVRHNFEFLSVPEHQKSLIQKIIEVVIKDKAIVSTREVLNLLYDLLVHPGFNFTDMCQAAANETKYLKKYIEYTTPMLMYEYDDISPLINAMRKHDLLKIRRAELDVSTTRFHSLDNICETFLGATAETPYAKLNDLTQIAVLGGIKPELKKLVYRFIVRIKEITGEYPDSNQNKLLSEYIKYLYYQNIGDEAKLSRLYESTKKAVMNWDGKFENDYICIDDSNEKFWVLEQLLIKPTRLSTQTPICGDVLRFATTLKLRFRKASESVSEGVEISMDYSLFEMISAMREGYRPTIQDKHQHTDFVSFVQRLIEFGNKATRIDLIPKDSECDYRVVFEKTDFGNYEFKVV